MREVGFGVIRMTDPPVLCYKGTDRVEVPGNQEEVPAKGVFGCNLELFQSDVDPCFHRRQLVDN